MKGSMFGKWMYVACALAGCFAGSWLFTSAKAKEIKPNTITEDNTLFRESEDSVFFDVEEEVTVQPEKVVLPSVTAIPTMTPALGEVLEPEEAPVILPTEDKEPETVAGQAVVIVVPESMPSLASQWVLNRTEYIPEQGNMVISAESKKIDVIKGNDERQEVTEVITYPVEIFGQTPIINRSDAYVSYFEFSYDLVTMLEPEVKQRGLNMTTLLTKFVVKALFCGVDIEQLDINAPIPRRQAALTLWLAAGLLGEKGSDTSAKAVQNYVMDISGCSPSEKKAVAYLYEQGIVSGYNTVGQKFYPDSGLKTETGNSWLSKTKQCWK